MKRFYNILKSMTLGDIADGLGAKVDVKYRSKVIDNLGSLENANDSSIIYLTIGNATSAALDKTVEHKEKLKHVKAGACLIDPKFADLLPQSIIPVLVSDPKLAFIKLTNVFYYDKAVIGHGISKKASIHKSVKFKNKKSVHVGDFSVIEEGVEVGENVYIASGVKIKVGVVIGDNCVIKENAVISHTIIGNSVNIGEGSVIGGNGFGWHSGSFGHIWVPQLGRVILEDNVDIGINTAVDRGAIGDTVIGKGSKIDNLVQIAHNVKVGQNCILAGMAGIAGSTILGNWVLIGAMAGVSGHLKIADGVQIGAGSGVIQNIDSKVIVSGYPAQPVSDFLKQTALLRRLVKSKK